MAKFYSTIFGNKKKGYEILADGSGAEVVTANQGAAGATAWPMQERPTRATAVLHRDAITAADKVLDLANTDLTTADNGVDTGSLVKSTTYKITAIPGNRWGPCKVATTINSQATAAYATDTGSIRLTIPQRAGAEWYNLFLSVDAAPYWVARLTEAQRAAGDFEVTAVGTVTAGGGNPAGTVDINVPGTGTAQTSNVMFTQNNAYRPDNGGITAIDCTGRRLLHVSVKLALTDLRSAPTLSLLPCYQNPLVTADWHMGERLPLALLNDLGQPLERVYALDVSGVTALKILVGEISGQGAAASVHVQAV